MNTNPLRDMSVGQLSIISAAITQLIENTDDEEISIDDEQTLLDAVDAELAARLCNVSEGVIEADLMALGIDPDEAARRGESWLRKSIGKASVGALS